MDGLEVVNTTYNNVQLYSGDQLSSAESLTGCVSLH